jgi:hypothetical protein
VRVVLKPAGLIIVTLTLFVLAFLAVANGRWRAANGAAEAALPEFKTARAKKSVAPPAVASPGLLEPGGLTLTEAARGYATLEPIPPAEQPTGCADGARVTVTRKPAEFQRVQIRRKLAKATGEGQTLTLRFWSRSLAETTAHAGNNWQTPKPGRVSAFVGERNAVYTKAFFVTVTPGPVWKEHVFTFTAPAYQPGQAEARLLLGYEPGRIEIAGLRLE